MAPLSLLIVQDNGTVTKKVNLDPAMTVREAHAVVRAKTHVSENEDTYGLFLRSPDNEHSGVWLEDKRTLSYYMLRSGSRLDYINRIRNLRIKMLDDTVKTLQMDQSKLVADLMINICGRLGITNHEEYGLCLEKEEDENKERGAGPSGTLTLKKSSQLRDRDLQFEQLSKKLKTDDNVKWIDAHKSLSEAGLPPSATVVLMRRLFFTYRNVDARDPVSLNLLYVQARDNILDQRHPVTEDQAVAFAGIQCQVHFGDFQEDKHKPGFIENLKEYLPEQYVSAWSIEKKILKEYRKHQGLSALHAKHLYTKTAEALPTYGVTFFLVKEKQKDKKKLVPRLLGINFEAILRLDETTKEILQEWPLTHVKTYHAAKGEIFTLNFGGYSEKEYSVKTRDAYRIRDILEDYIDLIRKRMQAQYNCNTQESAYITQDNIQSSQANVVQHMSNTPMKIVEQSFVGPSSIITTDLGSKCGQGAQIVTVQQLIQANKGNITQNAVKSEVGMRGDMSIPFTRRLNRLNSNSVKIVTLLSEPSDTRMEDSRKIVEDMNADLPFVREGVNETIDKQTSEDEKKKLRDQMSELDKLMRSLTEFTTPGSADATEAGDAAMKIADLTTQMYFALDTTTKRRSKLIRRSHPSFVDDENTQRNLRKASFIVATTTAVQCAQHAQELLEQEYTGPALDVSRRLEVEGAAVDKLGKLNAAIAHYILAHSDPQNVNYDAAINSMHTINEIVPEYCKDVQALVSGMTQKSKENTLADSKALCDAIRQVCSATGIEDKEKMQLATKDYVTTSGRLVFVFGKGKNDHKYNEMLDLADEVASKTSVLLRGVQGLCTRAPAVLGAQAQAVDAAGVRAADAARELITQVQLTAPTILEPHCQSAVTAAAEGLSFSVQRLASTWKPLVESPEERGAEEALHHDVMELAAALDRLKAAYGGLGGDDEGDVFESDKPSEERQRLKFISTVTAGKKKWQQVDDLLTQPELSPVDVNESEAAHARFSRCLGQLNAAIEALLAASRPNADRNHADYAAAEQAINTINELMPQVVQDSKLASANQDAEARAAMMEHTKALCDCVRVICASEDVNPQDRDEAIAKFKNADEKTKLVFGISHRGNAHKDPKVAQGLPLKSVVTADQLKGTLGSLKKAGPKIDVADLLQSTTTDMPKEQQRLQFIKTMSHAREQIQKAEKSLDKPIPPPQSSDKADMVQQRLSGRLGELNAAIASLLAATSREETEYAAAEDAVRSISDLMPYVVQDTQLTSAGKDAATRAAMLDLISELCDASRAVCAGADGTNTQGLNNAVAKFSDAAGKLVYVVNPRVNSHREKKIDELSAGACQLTSHLLVGVQQLSSDVGGEAGRGLDARGAELADAAHSLAHTTQVTAPSISDPHCKKALLKSIDQLSSCSQELAATWKPLRGAEGLQRTTETLDAQQQKLDKQLEELKKACHLPDRDVTDAEAAESPRELQRLQFVKTMSGTKEQIEKAQKALDKPIPPPLSADKSEAVQQRLSGRLGDLNAAIASLLNAMADREKPDYRTAEEAVKTISELMPHVVQDTQSSSANKDAATRAAMLDLIRELCDASRAVCAGADGTDAKYQGLDAAAAQFSKASGRLQFVVNPRDNADRTKQIMELSAGASKKAAALLASVQKLPTTVEGKTGEELEAKARCVDDAAVALEKTARITAPSISSPACERALVSSADRLGSSAKDLVGAWKPLLQGHSWNTLRQPLVALEEQVAELKTACHLPDGELEKPKASPLDSQRLQFAKTMSATRDQIERAQGSLEKPVPPCADKSELVHQRLAGRLGELNAAIANLLMATAGNEKPDYKTAELSVKTIGELLPQVVRDTQSSSASKDAAARAAMLDLIRELCDASRALCAGADGTKAQNQGLDAAAAQFSKASGRLQFVVNPRDNADRTKQIMELSAGASKKAAALLASVQKLPTTVEGKTGEELEAKARCVDDAAVALENTAKITAPSISSPACERALVSSADRLDSSAKDLVGAWKPVLQGHSWNTLRQPLVALEEQVAELKTACHLPDGELQKPKASPLDSQRLQFAKTMSATRDQIERAQGSLDKPVPPCADKSELVHQRLAGRLGELNAAIANLLMATADNEKPDYKTAELSVKTIGELLPQVVRDTQSSSACKDAAARAAMLDLIRELCDASRALCAGADGTHAQGRNDVSKFSDASNKLMYAVNPRVNVNKENQIIALAAGACSDASKLLSLVEELSHDAPPAQGQDLDAQGARLADAAQGVLRTAQVTAASISERTCQNALLTAVNQLASCSQQLAQTWRPLQAPQSQVLETQKQYLDKQLEDLKKACQSPAKATKPAKETHAQQKARFIESVSGSMQQIQEAQKALDKPIPPPLSADKAEEVRLRLFGRLAELNAAIASLLVAPADRKTPYYQTAEKAVRKIADVLPHVIQDTQAAAANQEAEARAAALAQLARLGAACAGVCAGVDGANPQDLSKAVAEFSEANEKLLTMASPHANKDKEQMTMDLAAETCAKTSHLLSEVQKFSQAACKMMGGGQELDNQRAAVADAAQALLAAAQVTAPSITDPHSKAALLSAVELLSGFTKELTAAWQPYERYGMQASELQLATRQLEMQMEALRSVCIDHPPAAPKKKAPPTPARQNIGDHSSGKKTCDATKEFLDRMRAEESQGHKPTAPAKPPSMTDDEKRQHQLFVKSVDEAGRRIEKAQEELKQSSKSENVGPAISVGDSMAKQARLQRNIALAGVEVASLVGANYADNIDYAAATKSTESLPQYISAIVEDGKALSGSVSEQARRAFVKDMLQLCESSRRICDAAKNDREKLNEAAVEFGDNSATLLYIVSNDVDPTLEKEIISRAKAVGDSLAQISVTAGSVAGSARAAERDAGAVRALCAAGARAQDAAGKLIYTAKLVAPSIYEQDCQRALFRSADSLSTDLGAFSESWAPFATDPAYGATVKELRREADNLDRILEGLKSDVKGGRFGQRREIQQLVVEDTPLRQLTMKIIEDAKKLSSCPEVPPELQRDYLAYNGKLSDALRSLDLANARCKRTPHDTNKRRELENAIQNLQMILLQSRPTRGDKERGYIVDLRDFIDEVSSGADNLAATTGGLKVPVFADKKALEDISANAQKISKAAYKLTHRDGESGFDTSFEDILDVDQFGQECDEVIADIDRQLQSIENAKARAALHSKILPLTESCNMLRFATKSGISSEKGARLESTLDDLDDIESRVITSIVDDPEMANVTLRSPKSSQSSQALSAAGAALSLAACSARSPRAPLTAYIASANAVTDTADPTTRNQLLKHLYKLVHLMKTQTVATSQLTATWQPPNHPEEAAITDQILKEIESPETKFLPETEQVKGILNERDMAKLLVPSPAKVLADKKQQEDKLTQLCTKLSSMSGTLTLSVASANSLTRSAHAVSDVAIELSAVARGCKDNKNPVQSERTEKAVESMTFTTYGMLRAAETACRDHGNAHARRRLADSCRELHEAINRVMQAASSASPMKKDCVSHSLALQLQAASLQGPPAATSAKPFQQCCQELEQHQETINKLKSSQPMTRHEFARSLDEVKDAVCRTSLISSQCAYLISVSEKDSDIAQKGPVDVPQIQKSIESLQDSCMAVIGSSNIQQAKDETEDLQKRVEDFTRALDDAQLKVKDGGVRSTLSRAKEEVATSVAGLCEALKQDQDMNTVTPSAVNLLNQLNRSHSLIESCPLVPSAGPLSAETKARCDELSNNNKTLISHTLALVKEVNSADDDSEMMTWVTFSTAKTNLLDAYEALTKSIRVNGQRSGILEPEDEEEEVVQSKSYLDTQVDLAYKWLLKPRCKAEVKSSGQQATRHIIDIATKMSEDLKGSEREEIRNMITEAEELLTQCSLSYDIEKYSVLMERIKELKKAIQRGVVTRVVEDFLDADDSVDLDAMVEHEPDTQKRKFLLERKIAELLSQLGRLTRTARFVADAGGDQHASGAILHCTEQTELLAPMLVQSAQERITSPDNKAVIDNYNALLAKYTESISKVRDLCDRAVDPMDFVQTAGDAMQRMREESSKQNDAQRGHQTSQAIIKLANRTIAVSMSSPAVQRDPELRTALQAAQSRLQAATPPDDCRRSCMPDWRESTAEVLRTTSDVEACLGGENIFKKKPMAQGSNQQIYTVARELHESVREWSSRDNDIVAAARRVAVHMARLSEHVENEKKQSLITTSKSIVSEAGEVAALARKLAHECTDVRIKTNLLQTCERIPTISAQLKMLTTVKSQSLGRQGTKEDTEAMDMLVGNAQSLMLSIQEVVKAAAGASVKIMSQRGPRLRWVRKNYY